MKQEVSTTPKVGVKLKMKDSRKSSPLSNVPPYLRTNKMKYKTQGNCPYCDSEMGITSGWGMGPDGWASMKSDHDNDHPNNDNKSLVYPAVTTPPPTLRERFEEKFHKYAMEDSGNVMVEELSKNILSFIESELKTQKEEMLRDLFNSGISSDCIYRDEAVKFAKENGLTLE